MRVPFGLKRGVALLEHVERSRAADQFFARPAGEFAIGVVGEGDAACRVAQHDQVALRFEQAAGARLGFLQFPVAVGERLVVQGDLAHFLAHAAQPEALGRQRKARDREQETRADRKGVGVIAGNRRAASGDEAIGAAEGGGEDHEGADDEGQPGMRGAKSGVCAA